MKTDFETLRALSTYTVNFLKDGGMIEFDITKRTELVDDMAAELNVGLATDEDIKEQAIEEVEEKMGEDYISDDITETEIYNHARKEIIKSFSGENIGGLYLVESLHLLAVRVKDFLLSSDLVEDVFGSDEEIVQFLVEKIKGFNQRRA